MDIDPVPSPTFLKKLRAFDPDLVLNWDRAQRVWSIWHKDIRDGSFSHVMNVMEPDGTYRQLDERVFLILERNRFYAENSHLLVKPLCDDWEKDLKHDRKVQAEKAHSEYEYLAKDRTLNRKFEEIRDMARSVSLKDWKVVNKPSLGGDNDETI